MRDFTFGDFVITLASGTAIGAAVMLLSCPAHSAETSGIFHEPLALPNGMEIAPLSQDEITRFGACGPWGCKPHERTGETVNNQFNPSDKAGGSYTNSGAMNLRYATRADADGGLRLAIVDANDRRPSTGFTATLRGVGEDGTWQTLGRFKVEDREPSGTVHYLTAKLRHGFQRVAVIFRQSSHKVRHGDITGIGRGVCHAPS